MPAASPRPRQARVRRIRTTVVAWSTAAFLSVWGLVYVQMSAGHDPALGAGTAPAVTQTTTTPSTASTSSGSTTSSAPAATTRAS